MRHQFYMYLHHKNENLLNFQDPLTRCSEEVSVNKLDLTFQSVIKATTDNHTITLSKYVTFEGLIYDQGSSVIVDYEDDIFQFGCIQHCYFVQEKLYLLCQQLKTYGFNRHYNCYEVKFTNEYKAYSLDDLVSINPHGIYNVKKVPGFWLIPLKTYVRNPQFI